MAQKNR